MIETGLGRLAARLRGASAISYALLLGLISASAIGSVTIVGNQARKVIETYADGVAGQACSTPWGSEIVGRLPVEGYSAAHAEIGGTCTELFVSGTCDPLTAQIEPAVAFQSCACPSGAGPAMDDGSCQLIAPATNMRGYEVPALRHAEQRTVTKDVAIVAGNQTWQADFRGETGDTIMLEATETLLGVTCEPDHVPFADQCIAAQQSSSCSGSPPPANATAFSTTFSQFWDGSAYQPASIAYRHALLADGACEWACDSGYALDLTTGADCRPASLSMVSCAPGSLPADAIAWPGQDQISQSWTGTAYAPAGLYSFADVDPDTNACAFACDVDHYWTGSACHAVAAGEYAAIGATAASACTNKPDNSGYIGRGAGANACPWACGVDRFESSGTCAMVGSGYYSPDLDDARTACTNKPTHASYTGSGGGTNNCSWLCNGAYYLSGNTCSAVGTGYYSPASNNTRYSCTNKPANSYYTSGGGSTNNCSWNCNSGYNRSGNSCVQAPVTASFGTFARSNVNYNRNSWYNVGTITVPTTQSVTVRWWSADEPEYSYIRPQYQLVGPQTFFGYMDWTGGCRNGTTAYTYRACQQARGTVQHDNVPAGTYTIQFRFTRRSTGSHPEVICKMVAKIYGGTISQVNSLRGTTWPTSRWESNSTVTCDNTAEASQ